LGLETDPLPLTASQIAAATGCPADNVSKNWPLIRQALLASGINSDLVEIAAAATIAVETGNFDITVCEKQANPAKQPDLAKIQARYYPFYGRGPAQLTWETNYKAAGDAIGVDLVRNPERACEPEIAARVFVWFLTTHHVDKAAESKNWRLVRKTWNGGFNGWEPFNRYVNRLLEALC